MPSSLEGKGSPEKRYVALKRALESVYSQLKYYPEGHPSRRASLEHAVQQMAGILGEEGELTFSVSGGHFLINAEEVQDPHRMGPAHFEEALSRVRAGDITVAKDIDTAELETFFGMIQRALEGETTVEDQIRQGLLPHMRVEVVRWERVREGDVVVSEDEAAAGVEGMDAIVDLEEPGGSPGPSKADRAIAEIVVKEYASGELDPPGLARLALRLFADHAALKATLSHLRRELAAAGMKTLAYVEFVREINREVKGEDLVRHLEKAATASGATVEELMAELRSDPEHTGKLMILAAELEQRGEKALLVKTLAETVDHLAARLLDDVSDAKSARESARVLRSVEKAVSAELRARDADATEVADFQRAAKAAAERLPIRGMVGEVVGKVRKGARDRADVAQGVFRTFGTADRFRAARATLMRRLQDEGLRSADIRWIAEEVSERFAEKTLKADRRKLEKALLDGEIKTLSRPAVEWLVEREIPVCRQNERRLAAFLFELVLAHERGTEVCRDAMLLEWAAGLISTQAGPEAVVGRFDETRLAMILPGAGESVARDLCSALAAELRGYRIEYEGVETGVDCNLLARVWKPIELAGRDAKILFRELRDQPMETSS